MKAPRVLIVDDDRLIRATVRECLEESHFRVVEAGTGAEARDQVVVGADLVLLDVGLPDVNGVDLLRELRDTDPELVVIMLTGDASADTAVRAMKEGAFHYVIKPVRCEELALLVDHALETTRLRREVTALRGDGYEPITADSIIGISSTTRQLRELLQKVASSPASTVLISGETGTGKDLAARVVHACSDRVDAPLMSITCTAVPDTLFESELFGHERGAFTDARTQRKGLIELADGGTVFLDEIAELPASLQGKLLRFLEDKTIRRIGGGTDIRVDVRVIAATNRDLREMVAAGTFREDLYYRLRVLPVEIPPLRERHGDVKVLAQHFAGQFARQFHKPVADIEPAAVQALNAHIWPGNVRELRNSVERAVLLAESDRLAARDFMLADRLDRSADGSPETAFRLPSDGVRLEEVERQLVVQALERTGGNQTRAGSLLGLNRDQIRYRVQKFNLDLAALSNGHHQNGGRDGG